MNAPENFGLEPQGAFAVFAAILVAAVTGAFAYLTGRHKSKIEAAATLEASRVEAQAVLERSKVEAAAVIQKAAVEYQNTLNDSFESLVKELRQERRDYRQVIREQNDKIDALTAEVHSLKALLTSHGISIPPSGLLPVSA
jgi:chromosome segregation ATPase